MATRAYTSVLTPRAQRFAELIAAGENSIKAARIAEYAVPDDPTAAKKYVQRMLRGKAVREYLNSLAQNREVRRIAREQVHLDAWREELRRTRMLAEVDRDWGTCTRLLELEGKSAGLLRESLIIDDERQREFSDSQREWARRVTAAVVLNPALPAPPAMIESVPESDASPNAQPTLNDRGYGEQGANGPETGGKAEESPAENPGDPPVPPKPPGLASEVSPPPTV